MSDGFCLPASYCRVLTLSGELDWSVGSHQGHGCERFSLWRLLLITILLHHQWIVIISEASLSHHIIMLSMILLFQCCIDCLEVIWKLFRLSLSGFLYSIVPRNQILFHVAETCTFDSASLGSNTFELLYSIWAKCKFSRTLDSLLFCSKMPSSVNSFPQNQLLGHQCGT